MCLFIKITKLFILGSLLGLLTSGEVLANGPKDAKVDRILAKANARAKAGEDPAAIERDMQAELEAPEYVVTKNTKVMPRLAVAPKPSTSPASWDIYGNAEARRLKGDETTRGE